MRPTYHLIAHAMENDPNMAQALRQMGMTAHQAAAIVFDNMMNAPTVAARDQIFKSAMYHAGIVTSGVEGFDKGTEAMLREMPNRAATERHAQRLSDESRKSHAFWSPERIAQYRDVAAKVSLTQGLNDRMRAADKHREQHDGNDMLPKRADVDEYRDDRRELRSALSASIATHQPDRWNLSIHRDEERSLRETLSDAFGADDLRTSELDPLADERLLSISDALK